LVDLAIKLLTPTKPARDGDALVFRGFRFTTDQQQVLGELRRVHAKVAYGAKTREASLDDFVDDAQKDLTPDKIQDRRPKGEQASGPATDKLAADVRSAMDTGRQTVHGEHNKLLIDFVLAGLKEADKMLDRSRDEVQKERERYGIKVDRTKILGIVVSEKTSIAQTPDTQAMLKAVADLKLKFGNYALAKGLKSQGLSIYAANQEEATQKATVEYNTARAIAEQKFPIIATFELDLAKGLQLEPTLNRLLEEPASMLAPQVEQKMENISTARNTLWADGKRIWGFPSVVAVTKSAMQIQPDTDRAAAVDDRIREKQEELANRQLILGALMLGLYALSPVTGGVTGYAATGLGALMAAEAAQEAMIQEAMAGTAFQKAQAISQQSPDWFWVAADIVASIVDLGFAAAEFKAMIKLRQEVALARGVIGGAAKDEKLLNEGLAQLKQKGNAHKPGLGDRMAQDAANRTPSPEEVAAFAAQKKAAGEATGKLATIDKLPRGEAAALAGQALELLPPAEVLQKSGGWAKLAAAVGDEAPALRKLDVYRGSLAQRAEAAIAESAGASQDAARTALRNELSKGSGLGEAIVEQVLGLEIQALGEALAKDQGGLGGICVESTVDLAQITKEDAQSPTAQPFVQRVPGVGTREERALAGFSGSTFEIIGAGGLEAGAFAPYGVPKMDFVLPGQHNASGWGIDRIGLKVEGSQLRIYHVEMKYVDVGSAHIPELGHTSHGTQTGLTWTTDAAHQLVHNDNKVARASRVEIEKALKSLGFAADAATMERVLLRRLPKAQVIVLTPFYAPLHALQAQVRGLIRQGRSMILVPARPIFGPRGGRL
jgi:hypothetical protein